MEEGNTSYNLKLLLLGDGYVGKTSLRKRFMGHQFQTQYLETLGADFAIKKGNYKNTLFRYQIWDLAGQPRFDSLRRGFFTGAQAALIVFDITNAPSADNVKKWTDEFWKFNGRGKLPIVIIGNKIDLRESAEFSLEENVGMKIISEIESPFNIEYLETSAKTGENVNEAFEIITREFVKFNKLSI
ncbi:MAG: Rab family GTPase [Candidatus Thorarchaeota archaeon]